jgi:PAS domain S-box-containing protein
MIMQAAGKPVVDLGSQPGAAPPAGQASFREISPAEYDFSPVAQVSLDRNGRICCLNRAAADMLGGSKSALLRVPFLACIEKSYYRAFLDHLTTCVDMRMEVWTEIGMAEFTRSRSPIELRSAPGIDLVSGEVVCRTALVPTRSLSKERQIEEGLHRAKNVFTQVLANNALATAMISLATKRFVVANQAFYELIGLEEGDIVGRRSSDLGLCLSSAGQAQRLEDLWSIELNQDSEWILTTAHGKTVDVIASTRTVSSGGEPCLVLTLQDMSDLQRLKSDIVRISEQEQRRFARDLHDSHCQDLTAIVFFAEAIACSLDETDKENARQARTLADMVRKSADTAHRLASDLGALAVEQSGLAHALQELASRTRDRFGVECSLAAKGVKTIRDRVAATHLYRIAQEATSNAARHGHAKKIEVSLAVDDEQGVLKISDDGEGFFADNKSTGLGLRTMKYRAAEINGALRFESTPNVGTTVICSFPVRGA